MRCLCNSLFVIVAVLALTRAAPAQDSPDVAKAKAKATLTLLDRRPAKSPMTCDATCHGDCNQCCGPLCPCDAVRTAKQKAMRLISIVHENDCSDDLAVAIKRAEREKKLLFVWVGMTCIAAPHIRDAFPDAIHCHADSLNGSSTPRLLVGRVPSKSGAHVFPKVSFTPDTPARIRECVTPAMPQRQTFAVPMSRPSASC